MYSKRVGLKTSFEVSIANLTSFKEGPGEIFSLEFWIYLFDLSVQCAIIDISDMSNTIGRNSYFLWLTSSYLRLEPWL